MPQAPTRSDAERQIRRRASLAAVAASLPKTHEELALRGIKYRPMGAAAVLRRNLLIYGLGGIIIPFVGIKIIDLIITAVGLA